MGSGSRLRPEAVPVRYSALKKQARKALDEVVLALGDAADEANPSGVGGAGSSNSIDTNRKSRIFFISGEPGSGKSTVYLSLWAMLSDEKRFAGYSERCPYINELNSVKAAATWLEPIDLEVVGDERENLLAAVLVRLFEALDGTTAALSGPCEVAIKELEDLATDIGIAWEGNLRKRAGAIDPATYSEEVMLAQRARLGVNKRLMRALDKLAKARCGGCHEGTLFILPVDDMYLRPDASLQLLRLLRMISVPRLFFLVMGDIKTVEALFTEKSLADWITVAGNRTFPDGSKRLDEALGRARELCARYLRKLLPPAQRAVIEAMTWDEALDFQPENLAGC